MASKALALLGLFAFLLLVSEVAAASDTVESESEETVQPDHYGHGGHGGYNGGGCVGQGETGGGRCPHGCCRFFNHRCVRCCRYAGEAVQTQPGTVDSGSEKTVQPDQYGHGGHGGYNEGGREGQGQRCGGCRHRCCLCIRGHCVRCCSDAGEAVIASSLGI